MKPLSGVMNMVYTACPDSSIRGTPTFAESGNSEQDRGSTTIRRQQIDDSNSGKREYYYGVWPETLKADKRDGNPMGGTRMSGTLPVIPSRQPRPGRNPWTLLQDCLPARRDLRGPVRRAEKPDPGHGPKPSSPIGGCAFRCRQIMPPTTKGV